MTAWTGSCSTCSSRNNPQTGRRQQARRRCATERAARDALAQIADATARGQFVSRSALTVEQVCADYLAGRHKLRESSKAKLEYDLAPLGTVRAATGAAAHKAHIDALVLDLVAGGPDGKGSAAEAMVGGFREQGHRQRRASPGRRQSSRPNRAKRRGTVNRVSKPHKPFDTYTEAEVQHLLAAIADDRLSHAWELALSGLRRGEIAGLRWSDVDLDAKTLSIVNNRVDAGGTAVENDPKRSSSRRTLPLPDRLVSVLRAAKARQARERLALGAEMARDYVVSNEVGLAVLTRRCYPGTGRRPSRQPVCGTSSCMRPGTPAPR